MEPEPRERSKEVVDLKHASPAQRRLADQYYQGYIPTLALFDKAGRLIYDRAVETESRRDDTEHLRELSTRRRGRRVSVVAERPAKTVDGCSTWPRRSLD